MPTRHFTRPLAALALALLFCTPAVAKDDDFKAVVQHVRAACGGKKIKIPFLGLANFAAKFVRPAGVKSFKLAVFEELTMSGDLTGLGAAVGRSLGPEWRALVRVRVDRGAEQTYVYVRDAGDDLKLMVVTLDGNQATVVQAKVSPEALARFARDPNLLGISL